MIGSVRLICRTDFCRGTRWAGRSGRCSSRSADSQTPRLCLRVHEKRKMEEWEIIIRADVCLVELQQSGTVLMTSLVHLSIKQVLYWYFLASLVLQQQTQYLWGMQSSDNFTWVFVNWHFYFNFLTVYTPNDCAAARNDDFCSWIICWLFCCWLLIIADAIKFADYFSKHSVD